MPLPTEAQIAKMSDEELTRLYQEDFEFYAAAALYIRTKAAELIPFRFNRVQKIVHAFAQQMMAELGYVRIILLKFRQFGGSTYIGARLFHRTATRPYEHGKVVAHTTEAVTMLFEMQERYYKNLPPALKPQTTRQGKTQLYFANPSRASESEDAGLDSSLSVYSARTSGAGRGATLRALHCSELPQWPKPKDTMLGLLNTVPKDGVAKRGTEVWLESTAKGVGDYFWRTYNDAKSGKSEFRALFVPWYLMDEYQTPVPRGFEMTQEETELHTKEHPEWAFVNPMTGKKTLSKEQIHWRRLTIATECDNDPATFKQEYPLTDDEAFITSGKPFFNQEDVGSRLKVVRGLVKPIFVGDVDLPLEIGHDMLTAAAKMRKEKLKRVANPHGSLRVWREPKEDESYYFGADVSDGLPGGDQSVLKIRCRQDGFEVACWKGHVSPDVFGFIIYVLGRHYNDAYGSPETNNHGLTTLSILKQLYYPGIYLRTQYDKLAAEPTETEGWVTSARTRPLALDAFKKDFTDDSIIVNDLDTLLEMQTFVKNDTGKFEAQDGCFDDHVMAEAVAAMMKLEIKSVRPRKRTRIKAKKLPSRERDPYTGY